MIRIYSIYLRYVSPDDIHSYSIDEVFIDLSGYLKTYRLSPRQLVMKMIFDVLKETGITATAGLGTNLYLAKVAMDIQAKHIPTDKNGVRIAALDEMSYRRNLWTHRPLTDFWRVGRGYAAKLEANGLYTMGDIARCALGRPEDFYNEDLLCTIADIKAYRPSTNSLGGGQVLQSPYPFEKAKLIVREMVELLALRLVDNGLVTDHYG